MSGKWGPVGCDIYGRVVVESIDRVVSEDATTLSRAGALVLILRVFKVKERLNVKPCPCSFHFTPFNNFRRALSFSK